jgi:hypothetical protein
MPVTPVADAFESYVAGILSGASFMLCPVIRSMLLGDIAVPLQ